MSILTGAASAPQWIIKGEAGRVSFSTVLEFDAKAEISLPEVPIEQGSFATYNRIIEPRTINARLAVQGTRADLQNTIDRLEKMRQGLKPCTITTPHAEYDSFMLESFDYRRDDKSGFNLLTVDLRFKEIKEVGIQQTTTAITEADAADGSVVDDVDSGMEQTAPATSAETEAANTGGKRSTLFDILN